jgi:hypothetical protein
MEQSRRDSLEQQNKFMEQLFGVVRGQQSKNPEQGVSIGEFQKTKPPTFSTAANPLEADDWLRDIEQKLQTVGCTDQEKVRYASHQLFGPATTWWRNVQNIIPQDHIITWDEFKKRFRENYVPESIMEIKRKEFLNLKQESRTITAYLDRFNDLSRYAPDDTNTEAKKVYRFIEGLSPSIQLHIAPVKITEFQELVDRVILIENRQVAVDEERRKRARLDPRFLLRSGSRPAGPARTPMNGPPRPYMTGPPRPPITGPPQPTFDQPSRPVFRPPKAPIKCHICSGPHMARECPVRVGLEVRLLYTGII